MALTKENKRELKKMLDSLKAHLAGKRYSFGKMNILNIDIQTIDNYLLKLSLTQNEFLELRRATNAFIDALANRRHRPIFAIKKKSGQAPEQAYAKLRELFKKHGVPD